MTPEGTPTFTVAVSENAPDSKIILSGNIVMTNAAHTSGHTNVVSAPIALTGTSASIKVDGAANGLVLDGPIQQQGASLALTRPFVRRYVNSRVTPTNAGTAIGREALVEETVDNLHATGTVMLDGRVWTARTEEKAGPVEAGEIVRILRIEGVKLIVEPAENRKES